MIPVTLLAAAVLAFACALMDYVNSRNLYAFWQLGEELEQALTNRSGVHGRLKEIYPRPLSYALVLRVLYVGAGLAALAATVAL